jgi:hypothetical protein
MASSAHKKVIVRRNRGEILPGYLGLSGFVRNRALDLLDLSGRVVPLGLNDIKMISYVREFNLNDLVNPERLTRRTFLARPRTEGLWLRMTFTSGEMLEGLAPTDLTLLDDLVNDAGLFLIPPDIRSNTQRIFVPRTSISELTLLAVVTSPSKKKPTVVAQSPQQDLFEAELPPNARPN